MHLGTMKFKQRGREEQAEADGTKASIHSLRLLRRFLTNKYSIFEE